LTALVKIMRLAVSTINRENLRAGAGQPVAAKERGIR
jgi:hypothetical protein